SASVSASPSGVSPKSRLSETWARPWGSPPPDEASRHRAHEGALRATSRLHAPPVLERTAHTIRSTRDPRPTHPEILPPPGYRCVSSTRTAHSHPCDHWLS